MQGRMSNVAVPTAPVGIAQAGDWRARAVEEYERTLPNGRFELRAEFAARVLALKELCVPPEDVYTDTQGRLAVAGIDGTTFRLHRHGEARALVLVRPCAYCGTGHFESPEIETRADLGYALSAWTPLHEDCEDLSEQAAS